MGTPIDFISENNLQWQPSLSGALSVSGRFGYRGGLIVTEGKMISPEKQMPPATTLKHAIVVTDAEQTLLFAGELEKFEAFEPMFERFSPMISDTTLITLFVDNLMSDAVFEYQGRQIYAFSLDESSVWNELIEHADLEKRELKRMGSEEKIDALYDGLKGSKLRASQKSYEEVCAMKMA